MTRSSPAEPDCDVLVTVIVPVFNTHPELIERAVVSTLVQTYPKFELLIVDDGSTAEIAKFLDYLTRRDPRIHVVHRANGGVSAARNTGVENARGDFVAYLDADDYLEPGFLASALAMARTTEADAVFGGIRVLDETGTVEWRTGGPSANHPLLSTRDMIITACARALSDSPSPRQSTQVLSVTNVVSCIYRADTARRHRFPEGVSHAEDRLHNVHVLLNANCVAFCSDVWYVYDATHDQGATRRATPGTITALSRTVREFAGVGGVLDRDWGLSDHGHSRIVQAAADGVLNYLKVLCGVMAVVGRRGTNRAQLRQLLADPSVAAATAHAVQPGWQNRIFLAAARHRQIDILLILGWLWMRRGGLQMSVKKPRRSSRGGQHEDG